MRLFTLTIIAIVALCAGAFAQEPPISVTAGALFRHGETATAAFQFGGNINVMRSGASQDGTARGQVFIRPIMFYADDFTYSDELKAELQAVQAITMVKLWTGAWSFGIGAGTQVAVQTGSDDFSTVLCIESGWRPIKFVQFTLGSMYIPIGGDKPDVTYPYFSVGLDVADLIN